MLNAFPLLIAPGPAAALYTEHKKHHQINKGNKHQQRNEGAVADAPNPIQQKHTTIDLNMLMDGFYSIHLKNQNGVTIKKMIFKK